MKNLKIISAALCAVMLTASGCAKGNTDKETMAVTQVQESTSTAAIDTPEITSVAETSTDDKEEKKMTGVLDEKKDFMITIISDSDNEAYVFPVEDVSLIEDIMAGDKIVVTYTEDPSDSERMNLRSVEKQ